MSAKFAIKIDKNNLICTILAKNYGKNSSFKFKREELIDTTQIPVSIDIALYCTYNHGKIEMYYDEKNNQVTSKGGTILFNPTNGNSATYVSDSIDKMYVESIEENDTKKYLETLKAWESVYKEVLDLEKKKEELQKELNSKTELLLANIEIHRQHVSYLHDLLCKPLAISGYNEFKHKIHVEEDGSVFILNKEALVK